MNESEAKFYLTKLHGGVNNSDHYRTNNIVIVGTGYVICHCFNYTKILYREC